MMDKVSFVADAVAFLQKQLASREEFAGNTAEKFIEAYNPAKMGLDMGEVLDGLAEITECFPGVRLNSEHKGNEGMSNLVNAYFERQDAKCQKEMWAALNEPGRSRIKYMGPFNYAAGQLQKRWHAEVAEEAEIGQIADMIVEELGYLPSSSELLRLAKLSPGSDPEACAEFAGKLFSGEAERAKWDEADLPRVVMQGALNNCRKMRRVFAPNAPAPKKRPAVAP